jgi:hypothetical protein
LFFWIPLFFPFRIGEAVVDEWAKLIGDCDHNSSIDPTATSSCKQTKSSPNGDNEPAP